MSNELTEAERAAFKSMPNVSKHLAYFGTDDRSRLAVIQEIIAAVRPAIYDEIASEIEQSPMFIDHVGREALAHLFRQIAEGQRRSRRADNP
jgi:hypothetical protein